MKRLAVGVAIAVAAADWPRRCGASASCAARGRSGGSDSSCYALMARAFREGQLQPHSALAATRRGLTRRSRWRPAASSRRRFTPEAASPICAPGLSLLLRRSLAAVRAGGDLLADAARRRVLVLVRVSHRPAAGGTLAGAAGRHPHRDEADRAVPGGAADERHPDGGAVDGGGRRTVVPRPAAIRAGRGL